MDIIEFTPERSQFVYTFGGAEPVMRIQPGTALALWSEDAYNHALRTVNDRASEKLDVRYLNPQTGPFYVVGAEPGDTLAVAFTAPKAGKYHVSGRFLKARDYGIHQLAINGQKFGEPADFYNLEVRASSERDLGVFELNEGENEFSATVVGANEKAVKSYMFGLDYLLLKPAE